MHRYDVLVTIHYPENFKGKRYKKVGFIVRGEDEADAADTAICTANFNRDTIHKRKYKGCTFSVEPGDVKLFD